MYYTVIKHDGHLRTRGKCRKHEPQASVFYTSPVFSNSNVRSVLSQCNTRLRLLRLLYDIEVMWPKKKDRNAFSMFYTLIKHGFLTNQERVQGLSNAMEWPTVNRLVWLSCFLSHIVTEFYPSMAPNVNKSVESDYGFLRHYVAQPA